MPQGCPPSTLKICGRRIAHFGVFSDLPQNSAVLRKIPEDHYGKNCRISGVAEHAGHPAADLSSNGVDLTYFFYGTRKEFRFSLPERGVPKVLATSATP